MSEYNIGGSVENMYSGLGSSLESDYSINYKGNINAATLGFPGSAQTANQLGQTVNAIKQGTKTFEVELLVPETAETIPKQHFKEMRQLMKLSGVKPSVHGALIDPAGFTQQGWGGEQTIEDNERRMFHSIEAAHELDPKGSTPVVFHSSNGTPGGEWRPNGKDGPRKVVRAVINQDTGQIIPMKEKRTYSEHRPEELNPKDIKGSGHIFTTEDQIRSANQTEWDKRMTELVTFAKHSDELIDESSMSFLDYRDKVISPDSSNKTLGIFDSKTREAERELNPSEKKHYDSLRKGDIFLDNVELNFHSAFDQAFEYSDEKQRGRLKKLAEDYTKKIRNLEEEKRAKGVEFDPTLLSEKKDIIEKAIFKLKDITTFDPEQDIKAYKRGEVYNAPKIYKDAEEFAVEKASETFGNLAFKSYDKYKKGAPLIAIENMFPGFAYSSADEMEELIKKSREHFIDKLVKEKKFNREKAKKIAEEKIGMTLDVGHLNISKKAGFTDKDLQKYTKQLQPYVKHLHLTDNFGYADTHLAPGMGNVPFKEILGELEKNGQFKEMRKIVEAPGFVQHFQQLPHSQTLAAFGSPIYGAKMAPTWDQAYENRGNYFGGYGTTNPAIHHSLYGSGFTSLPTELGGNMPGTGSRFGGNSMT